MKLLTLLFIVELLFIDDFYDWSKLFLKDNLDAYSLLSLSLIIKLIGSLVDIF